MGGGSFGGGPDKDDSIRTDGAASSKSEGAAYTYVGFTPLWTFRTTPRATPQPAGYESQPAAGCEPIFSSPAVSTATGVVFFGCMDGRLYAVAPCGALRWAYDASAPIFSAPCLFRGGYPAEERLLFTAQSGRLVCLET